MSPENKVTANYWIKRIIITTIALLFLFSVIKLVQKFVVPRLWLQLLLVWLFLYCHHETDICCLHPHRIILKGAGGSVQNALVTFLPSSGQVWSSGDFDQARDIVSSHSLPAQFYPCSWNTDFIQMLKDKRSSIEKKSLYLSKWHFGW